MKLLLVGPLKDMSGYASAARNLAKALHYAGCDLVLRNIQYDQRDNGEVLQLEPWADEALKRPLEDIDTFIQCTTPNIEANPKPGILNGLYFFWESDRLPQHWLQIVDKFNFLIVASKYNSDMLIKCGIQKPIIVIPAPFDTDIYNKDYPKFDIPNAENRTIFYNISQLSGKKGIDSLIRAYYAAFADRPDEVLLVLKTYINMVDRSNDLNIIKNFVQTIKNGTRLPIEKYPPILPIVDILSDEKIQQLHSTGHAYVCSSRSEGLCLPAFEALAHGTTLISNQYGGLGEFVSTNTALVYGGCQSHVFDMVHGDPYIWTGIERWFEPSTVEMAHLMKVFHLLRKCHAENTLTPENKVQWEKILKLQENGKELTSKLDYRKVGSLILEQFNSAYASFKATGKVAFSDKVVS